MEKNYVFLYGKWNESGSQNKVSYLKQDGEKNNFCLKQGQGLKCSVAHLYLNLPWLPPPPPGSTPGVKPQLLKRGGHFIFSQWNLSCSQNIIIKKITNLHLFCRRENVKTCLGEPRRQGKKNHVLFNRCSGRALHIELSLWPEHDDSLLIHFAVLELYIFWLLGCKLQCLYGGNTYLRVEFIWINGYSINICMIL